MQELWTTPQRRVLVGVLVALAALLCLRYARNLMHVDDSGIASIDRSVELIRRLDPNTASADDLAALPVLGARQAEAIVAYREEVAPRGERAFRTPEDLLKVRGIGVQTLEALRPHLDLSVSQPDATTEPTQR